MAEQALGKKTWAFAAGHIPLTSTGHEPTFTSHDKIAILNTCAQEAEVTITIFYEDGDPVQDHAVRVQARRVRKIRFNDLIDPLPLPLDKPFGFIVHANVPVVVQFSRMDTGSRAATGFLCNTFPRIRVI